jgi:hypothetical protein
MGHCTDCIDWTCATLFRIAQRTNCLFFTRRGDARTTLEALDINEPIDESVGWGV